MVELSGKKYGIDISGNKGRIIARTYSDGRELIDTIIDVDPDKLNTIMLDADSDIYFSVVEKDAIIKTVRIPRNATINIDDAAGFEMAESLLGHEEKYFIESYSLNYPEQRLAVAYNKEMINKSVSFFQDVLRRPSGFKLRSLAMADAYLKYCRKEGGRLICLLDVGPSEISYCFLMDDRPVSVGLVEDCNYDESTGSDAADALSESLILDLITMIFYQLAAIRNGSRSLPLSRIVLTGSCASEGTALRIEEKCGIKSVLASLNKELFSSKVEDKTAKYLVSLGLTVND